MQLGGQALRLPPQLHPTRLGRALEVFDLEVHGDLCVELPDLRIEAEFAFPRILNMRC